MPAAKMLATETAQVIVDRCVQLLGGRRVMHGSIVERLYRHCLHRHVPASSLSL